MENSRRRFLIFLEAGRTCVLDVQPQLAGARTHTPSHPHALEHDAVERSSMSISRNPDKSASRTGTKSWGTNQHGAGMWRSPCRQLLTSWARDRGGGAGGPVRDEARLPPLLNVEGAREDIADSESAERAKARRIRNLRR